MGKKTLVVLGLIISLIGIKEIQAEEHENCTMVVTTEFQGKVCLSKKLQANDTPTNSTNLTYNVERREGTWVNSDGGVFQGMARITFDDQRQVRSLYKSGKLSEPTFQGNYTHYEIKNSPESIIGSVLTVLLNRMNGIWYIRPDLKLGGEIVRIKTKNGKITVTDKRKQIIEKK